MVAERQRKGGREAGRGEVRGRMGEEEDEVQYSLCKILSLQGQASLLLQALRINLSLKCLKSARGFRCACQWLGGGIFGAHTPSCSFLRPSQEGLIKCKGRRKNNTQWKLIPTHQCFCANFQILYSLANVCWPPRARKMLVFIISETSVLTVSNHIKLIVWLQKYSLEVMSKNPSQM